MPPVPFSQAKFTALGFALMAALAAFAVAAFSAGLLNDADTYWHIRAGEWMIDHRAVLRADIFSTTAAGQPWQPQEWLAEILMALGWRAGGWAGIHLLFGASAAVTAGVVGYFLRRRADFLPALLTLVLGLGCAAGSLLARPHLLALPLLALWTAGLVAAREKQARPSWWLILVMPLWANLHGSFAFGLALAAALGLEAVIESKDRRAALGWGLFLLLATASALLTPFGIQGLLFPLRLSGMAALAHIGEWQASDFSRLSPFAIALLAGIGALALGRIRLTLARSAILLGLVWLALSHSRHQMLLGVTAPLLLAPALAQAWPAKMEDGKWQLASLAALGFIVLILGRLLLPAVRGEDSVSPATALAHVPPFVRGTPVLNDYSFGGYLIWNGVKPFIDSRADLYGDAFLESYAALTKPNRQALATALDLHHVGWTIFPAGSPVAKLLDTMPNWHRFYSDRFATVHVRQDMHL